MMSGRPHIAILCLALALTTPEAAAREWSAGLFSSPSGWGLQAQACDRSGTEMDIITLTADAYGLLTGRTGDLGVKLGYTHDYVLGMLETEAFLMRFHAGAGVLTGYVHDNENAFLLSSGEDLQKEMGIVAALSCSIGLRFDFFARKVGIDLGLSANPGVHLRTDRENGSIYLSFYRNGIYDIVLPRVSIMYRF